MASGATPCLPDIRNEQVVFARVLGLGMGPLRPGRVSSRRLFADYARFHAAANRGVPSATTKRRDGRQELPNACSLSGTRARTPIARGAGATSASDLSAGPGEAPELPDAVVPAAGRRGGARLAPVCARGFRGVVQRHQHHRYHGHGDAQRTQWELVSDAGRRRHQVVYGPIRQHCGEPRRPDAGNGLRDNRLASVVQQLPGTNIGHARRHQLHHAEPAQPDGEQHHQCRRDADHRQPLGRLVLQVHRAIDAGGHLLVGGGRRNLDGEPEQPDLGHELHLQGVQRHQLLHGADQRLHRRGIRHKAGTGDGRDGYRRPRSTHRELDGVDRHRDRLQGAMEERQRELQQWADDDGHRRCQDKDRHRAADRQYRVHRARPGLQRRRRRRGFVGGDRHAESRGSAQCHRHRRRFGHGDAQPIQRDVAPETDRLRVQHLHGSIRRHAGEAHWPAAGNSLPGQGLRGGTQHLLGRGSLFVQHDIRHPPSTRSCRKDGHPQLGDADHHASHRRLVLQVHHAEDPRRHLLDGGERRDRHGQPREPDPGHVLHLQGLQRQPVQNGTDQRLDRRGIPHQTRPGDGRDGHCRQRQARRGLDGGERHGDRLQGAVEEGQRELRQHAAEHRDRQGEQHHPGRGQRNRLHGARHGLQRDRRRRRLVGGGRHAGWRRGHADGEFG